MSTQSTGADDVSKKIRETQDIVCSTDVNDVRPFGGDGAGSVFPAQLCRGDEGQQQLFEGLHLRLGARRKPAAQSFCF